MAIENHYSSRGKKKHKAPRNFPLIAKKKRKRYLSFNFECIQYTYSAVVDVCFVRFHPASIADRAQKQNDQKCSHNLFLYSCCEGASNCTRCKRYSVFHIRRNRRRRSQRRVGGSEYILPLSSATKKKIKEKEEHSIEPKKTFEFTLPRSVLRCTRRRIFTTSHNGFHRSCMLRDGRAASRTTRPTLSFLPSLFLSFSFFERAIPGFAA